MKKILAFGMMMALLAGCGGALDGDPKTDTTTMPVDTNLNKDTVNHINRTDGVKMVDTTGGKSDTLLY